MVENDAVNVTAYVRTYKDPTGVLWHNFNDYDSKKETGLIGIKNQGATCYLNSLLQSLYFTNTFRKAIFQIPTTVDSEKSQSAWALQRLFHTLQTSDQAASTNELTHAFSWKAEHIFKQQDVQELSRILMERMEAAMKGTDAENALAKIFSGKMKTYIACINIDYESAKVEEFWDIQLNVSGNKNLDDSFRDEIQVETMDGDNQYHAEGHGHQDAKKGVIFEEFPQVLHLQLKRFQYNIESDSMMKINDRHEFPEIFDAAPYLSDAADRSESWIYQLHGVLVHSGDIAAGHYYAFIKPTKDGHFYKFDDDRVTRATLKEALDENYGGEYPNLANGIIGRRNLYTKSVNNKTRSMNAYMLIYIRQSRLDSILQPVSIDDTPPHIARQIAEEKSLLEKRRKEKEEAHLYLPVAVISNDQFREHEGFDLGEWSTESTSPPELHRLLRTSTIEEFCALLAGKRGVPADHVRLWIMVNRQNKTSRPDQPITERSSTIEEAYIKANIRERIWRLWVEVATKVKEGEPPLPEIVPHSNGNILTFVFLKYFDADTQTLTGLGQMYVYKSAKVTEMLPGIAELMNWSPQQMPTITLYEEIKHGRIDQMNPRLTIQQAEIQDGDIVCFQKDVSEEDAMALREAGKYADAKEFYDYLLNRVMVQLYPRFPNNSPNNVLNLVLDGKLFYDQFAAKVGEELQVDPTHIRFFTVGATTNKCRAPIKRNPAQTLFQLLNPQYSTYQNGQKNDAFYYEVLEISLSELEQKKAIRLTWVSEGLAKEELIELLVPKTGTVADIIHELKRKLTLDSPSEAFKIFSILNSKISKDITPDYPVSSILDHQVLIAQKLAAEDRVAEEKSGPLINVFHFEKEPSKTHGIPFVFRLLPVSLTSNELSSLNKLQNETLKDLKVRISQQTGLKGKVLETIKFALVPRAAYAKPQYLQDGK